MVVGEAAEDGAFRTAMWVDGSCPPAGDPRWATITMTIIAVSTAAEAGVFLTGRRTGVWSRPGRV